MVNIQTKQHTKMFYNFVEKNNNMIYDNFNYLITHGNNNDIIEYIKLFNIDLNYEDGYFMELLAEKNDITLIKKIIEIKNYDIKLNNYGVLRTVAHKGYVELLDFLINYFQIDRKVLINLLEKNNYKEVKKYINNIVSCLKG